MDFSWISAANDLVTAIVTVAGSVGGYIAAHKRGWISASIQAVAVEGKRIVTDAEKIAEGLAEFVPGAQTVEEKLKQEVEELTAKARQTELYHVAAVGLHAFGTTLDALSEDQKKALEFDIASKVPGATPQEIAAALDFVQREATAAASTPLYTAANAFTQAQQAPAQPQQQSQQSA
ncbi:hypothetical protein [Alicyclobacillus shizuokensis]|uniref:hypothetical protein n=1 Tax=Alicyclobacillus shizuokensis TaxID=392014 RepID=UPI0008339939|nr:hypothetical protein [Alicyclobacillus shizuokensis]